jgi:hypothetical protein
MAEVGRFPEKKCRSWGFPAPFGGGRSIPSLAKWIALRFDTHTIVTGSGIGGLRLAGGSRDKQANTLQSPIQSGLTNPDPDSTIRRKSKIRRKNRHRFSH